MDIYMNEQEQVEALKRWWNQYGTWVMTGILLAAVSLVAWRWWHQYQIKVSSHASVAYQQLLVHVAEEDPIKITATANHITQEYSRTPYAILAAFFLAKQAVQTNKLDEAKKQLQWVIRRAKQPEFKQIAKIRLSRIFVAQKQYDAAMQLLKTVDASAYAPLVNELQGDIYMAKGEQKQARQAYQNALAAFPSQGMGRSLLQMKLDNLS